MRRDPQRGTAPGWVLVADADEHAGARLVRALQRRGWLACATRHGTEALRLAEAQPVTLAVVDVRLLDMAGAELAATLRARHPRMRIVVTSAEPRPDLELAARRAGVAGYLAKPAEPAAVEALLDRFLGPGRRVARRARGARLRDAPATGGAPAPPGRGRGHPAPRG